MNQNLNKGYPVSGLEFVRWKIQRPEMSPGRCVLILPMLKVSYAGSSIVVAIGTVWADRVAPDDV